MSMVKKAARSLLKSKLETIYEGTPVDPGVTNRMIKNAVSTASSTASGREAGRGEGPADEESRTTGTILWFNHDKGYGFIEQDEAEGDVFFHISKWKGQGRPEAGETVRFEVGDGQDGEEALNVRLR